MSVVLSFFPSFLPSFTRWFYGFHSIGKISSPQLSDSSIVKATARVFCPVEVEVNDGQEIGLFAFIDSLCPNSLMAAPTSLPRPPLPSAPGRNQALRHKSETRPRFVLCPAPLPAPSPASVDQFNRGAKSGRVRWQHHFAIPTFSTWLIHPQGIAYWKLSIFFFKNPIFLHHQNLFLVWSGLRRNFKVHIFGGQGYIMGNLAGQH